MVEVRLWKFVEVESTPSEPSELVLRVPFGDTDSWIVLLHWLMHGKIPDTEQFGNSLELLVRSWNLGHRVELPAFQDLVMIELIYLLERKEPTTEAIRCAFIPEEQGLAMQRLMAEHAVSLLAMSETGECYQTHESWNQAKLHQRRFGCGGKAE